MMNVLLYRTHLFCTWNMMEELSKILGHLKHKLNFHLLWCILSFALFLFSLTSKNMCTGPWVDQKVCVGFVTPEDNHLITISQVQIIHMVLGSKNAIKNQLLQSHTQKTFSGCLQLSSLPLKLDQLETGVLLLVKAGDDKMVAAESVVLHSHRCIFALIFHVQWLTHIGPERSILITKSRLNPSYEWRTVSKARRQLQAVDCKNRLGGWRSCLDGRNPPLEMSCWASCLCTWHRPCLSSSAHLAAPFPLHACSRVLDLPPVCFGSSENQWFDRKISGSLPCPVQCA